MSSACCASSRARARAHQRTEHRVARADRGEAAVEQRVRNAGLRLNAVGELDEGGARRSGVDDQVGPRGDHRFEVRGARAAGDASDLGPVADTRQQELELFGPVGTRPAQQRVGRKRVELDRRRRPGREHALHLARHRHAAAGAVGDERRVRGSGRADAHCRQADHGLPAVQARRSTKVSSPQRWPNDLRSCGRPRPSHALPVIAPRSERTTARRRPCTTRSCSAPPSKRPSRRTPARDPSSHADASPG